jgi:hypothetical protein
MASIGFRRLTDVAALLQQPRNQGNVALVYHPGVSDFLLLLDQPVLEQSLDMPFSAAAPNPAGDFASREWRRNECVSALSWWSPFAAKSKKPMVTPQPGPCLSGSPPREPLLRTTSVRSTTTIGIGRAAELEKALW